MRECASPFAKSMCVVAIVLAGPGVARAQIDPLLPVKGVPPDIIVVMDTSTSMLTDANGDLDDVKTYRRADDEAVADALGVTTPEYRRIYRAFSVAADSAQAKYE